MNNSWHNHLEPVINSKQKIIDSFVNSVLNLLIDRIERTAKGASNEFMANFLDKEFAKTIEILTNVYIESPIVEEIKRNLDKPDYIWDSLFIECLNREEKHKWFHNTLDANIKDFKQNNTIYDNDHPYFSQIYNVVLYEKYAKHLLNKIKKYRVICSMEKEDLLRIISKSEQPKIESITNESVEQTKSEDNIASSTIPLKFEHSFNKQQIELLVKCVNKVRIFKGGKVTYEQLKSIFDCQPITPLQSSNNRLLASFFNQLSNRGYITKNWQIVIAKNHLFLSPKKKDFLNQNDIATALHDVLNCKNNEKSEEITHYIRNLKSLSE